jgi:serine/threonine-protein kinase
MYATVNTNPPPPSTHNRGIPAMLDLIVAKAMAKALDDRYQSVKEFADDLREVRRQLDAAKPSVALKARSAPPPPPRPASEPLGMGVATIPMTADGKHDKGPSKDDETTKPLGFAPNFDSFDATLRLASMTNQTEEFKDYISITQKMRAYRGKIEPGSPLAPAPTEDAEAPAPAPAPAPEPEQPRFKPIPRFMAPPPEPAKPSHAFPESTSSNMPAIVAIVILAIAAVALLVTLLIK